MNQLEQALERWPSATLDEINEENGVGDILYRAARQVLWLKQPCETCGGSGRHSPNTYCPTCDERGWNPNPEAIEVFYKASGGYPNRREVVASGLVALIEQMEKR